MIQKLRVISKSLSTVCFRKKYHQRYKNSRGWLGSVLQCIKKWMCSIIFMYLSIFFPLVVQQKYNNYNCRTYKRKSILKPKYLLHLLANIVMYDV